jgi:hypothetical protein
VRWTSKIKNQDTGTFVVAGFDGSGVFGGQILGQRKSQRREYTDLQEFAPFEMAGTAETTSAVGKKVEHKGEREIALREHYGCWGDYTDSLAGRIQVWIVVFSDFAASQRI